MPHCTPPACRILLAAAMLASTATAQLPKPVDGPPSWGVADNDTVSIYWGFDNQATPFAHHINSVVPAWYTFQVNDGFTQGATPVQWFANVNGHTGVVGIAGTGSPRAAVLNLQIENDPRVHWIKVFYLQFDCTAGASSSVVGSLKQDLSQYKRLSMTENSVALSSGWVRTTINAELLPQPAYEAISFALTETALATAGIDNLFVHSKCVKPWNDEDGEALGEIDAAQSPIDLLAAGVAQSEAAAVTEDLQGLRTYWVSSSGSALSTQQNLYRLTSNGQFSGAPIVIGNNTTSTPLGITSLTTETLPNGQQFVHGIRDSRLANGNIEILSINATTGTIQSTVALANTALALPAPPNRFGIVFYPPGNTGAGSFWITDNQSTSGTQGSAYEFDRNGSLLNPVAGSPHTLQNQLPLSVVGGGYDPLKGSLYFMSAQPQVTPLGSTRTNGFEISAYNLQPTGVVFFGDLTRPDAGGPGGTAKSMSVYRRSNGDWRAACIVIANGRSILYELKGPYRFGFNLLGRCGMQGLPMRGSNNFQVTLSGVPHATGAVLYSGFSNQNFGSTPLPFSLAPFGLIESTISVSLDMSGVFQPVINGSCVTSLPLPPVGLLPSNLALFFQWIVFDPTVPQGIASSQAGKTLIY